MLAETFFKFDINDLDYLFDYASSDSEEWGDIDLKQINMDLIHNVEHNQLSLEEEIMSYK